MSTHNQRGKVKTIPRARSQRMPVAPANFTKPTYVQSDENLGIYSNSELTYALGRHVIGNIGEVTTIDNDRILGVIKAISPDGDLGLAYAYSTQRCKNGQVGTNNRLIAHPDWKMIRITGVRPADCIMNELKTDAELAAECDATRPVTPEKELVPFFEPSEAIKDCSLDEGGFPVDEMFKTNKELFSVPSTYNADLREYTTPVDRNAPNFSETEARCAKMAEDIERNQSPGNQLEGASDDEEQAFSAVIREGKEQSGVVPHNRRPRAGRQRPMVVRTTMVNNTTVDVSRISVSGQKQAEVPRKFEVQPAATVTTESDSVEQPTASTVQQLPEKEVSEGRVTPEPPVSKSTTTTESVQTTSVGTTVTSVETKVKKSTLDPNAPPFHPMGLQSAAPQLPVHQPLVPTQPLPYTSAPAPLVSAHPGTFAVQTPPSIIAPQQAQRYGAVSMPYVSHSNQIPHFVPNVVSAPMSASIHHQMRAGSLPPGLHQQPFPAAINPGANILLQQPGISIGQVTSQPMFVTGPAHGSPFTIPTSNMGLARQRSNESSSTTHSNYGQQPNVTMSSFQSPTVYHLSQPANGIPFFLPGPPMGSHLLSTGVPGAGCSSALVLGNMAIPQTSGQQVYQGQTVLAVPPNTVPVPTAPNEQGPPPSTTPQQPTQQPFPQALGHFPEHVNPFQIVQYAHSLMFAPNQPNAGYYPTSAMLGAPNSINTAGMIPMMNQNAPNTQPPPGAHQQAAVDHSMVNAQQMQSAQFPQLNCQPQHLLPQFSAAQAQFVHPQQLSAGQHINPQAMPPNAYQAMAAAIVASGGNPSQGH